MNNEDFGKKIVAHSGGKSVNEVCKEHAENRLSNELKAYRELDLDYLMRCVNYYSCDEFELNEETYLKLNKIKEMK